MHTFVTVISGAKESTANRLDYCCDLVTKTYSDKLTILSTYSITYYPLLNCPIVKWFCGLYTRINFHLAKLLAVDMILYHTAFPRSFRDLTL